MGKTAKSITALSSKAKQKAKELKQAQLQKPQKKVITKDPSAKTLEALKAKRKADLQELKLLLKLEADAPINPRMLDDYDGDTNKSGAMEVDGDMNRRRKKPTGKQRRANQLRRANPQRETNPL